jgi:DNA polymerase I-like protein with 3'-5' exonuclease and polymerase domains
MLTEQQIKNIPGTLKERRQWIGWRAQPKGNGKIDKIPVNPKTGEVSDATDSSIHCSFEEALAGVKHFKLSGPGFVFTNEDPFSGVDLDDCVTDQEIQTEQKRILLKLNSYSEFSPSGKGTKTFLQGSLPGPNKNTPAVEMYSHSRFFTVTGNIINGNSALVEPRQKELEEVYFQHFPEEIPRFGPLFSRCYLIRFLKQKADSGVSLSHNTRIALASFSNSIDELDTEDMPFISMMLQGCPDFDPEKTRKQVESLHKKENQAPWGCDAMKKQVQSEFADFDPSKCGCNLEQREGRKPSPIRFIEPVVVEWVDDEDEETDIPIIQPFPVEIFPQLYQDAIKEIAAANVVPVEIPGCVLLSASGACIGRTRAIYIKPGWVEYSNLYFALIGKSGLGKSPPTRAVQDPLTRKNTEWFREYELEYENWENEITLRRNLPKEDKVSLGPNPKPPARRRILMNDSTPEALIQAFKDNPRGLLWTRDELAGLILNLDRYAGQKGDTKSLLMEGYDCGHYSYDRVKNSIYIPSLCLSIYGNIQPENMPRVFSDLDASMGFLPRFIFIVANRNRPATWTDQGVTTKTVAALSDLMNGLLALEFGDNGDPVFVPIDPAARELYIEWFNDQAWEPWREFHVKSFEAVLAKLKGQCFRLALILNCIEAIAEQRPGTEPITATTMENAIKLAGCFKSHQKHVWEHMIRVSEIVQLEPLDKRVLEAILRLKDQISKSVLQTDLITDEVNEAFHPRFHVEARAVGKTAKKLKLTTRKMPDGNSRGFYLEQKDIQRLRHWRQTYESESLDVSDVSDGEMDQKEKSEEGPENSFYRNMTIRNVRNVQESATLESGSDVSDVSDIENNLKEKIQWITSAELEEHISQNQIKKIFIDTETGGLDPLNDDLVLIQVMAGDEIFFLDPDEDMSLILANRRILKVGHNLKFDLQFLGNRCAPLFDTFVAERLLTVGITPLRKLSLENLAQKYLNIELDKTLRTSFEKGQRLTPDQIQYAAWDVEVLEPIFQAQKKKLKELGLVGAALLEFSIVPAVAQIELNGMLVDLKKLEILKQTLTTRVAYLDEKLRNIVKDIRLSDQGELFDLGSINYRSPDQVRRTFHALGLRLRSTGIGTLKKIDHPFAKTLVKYRKASKLLSSFVEALPKHINPKTERIHPGFHQLGTDTGRFTCSKPNLQQIPKEQEWRDLFVAPPGHKIITADYNQIELRILAELSQDPVFLEAYHHGKDLHQETANQIEVTREIAKTINFGLCYGMGSRGLAERLNIPVKDARSFISAYFKAYPRVKATLDQLGLKALSSGYSETPLGRKRYFKPVDSFSAQKSLERKGRNTPIQATCGDILKKAIQYLMDKPELKIINLVHDEIVFEVPSENATPATVQIIEKDMVRAGKEFLKTVPMVVDIAVNDVWKK